MSVLLTPSMPLAALEMPQQLSRQAGFARDPRADAEGVSSFATTALRIVVIHVNAPDDLAFGRRVQGNDGHKQTMAGIKWELTSPAS